MLPLWIVDLREKSDRRELFEALLGQIDHVYIENTPPSPGKTPDKTKKESEDALPNPGEVAAKDTVTNEVSEVSVEELIENDDKRKAEKESVTEGYWWRYSPMADKDYMIDISQTTPRKEAARITAEKLYEFQSDLVAEGQRFIRDLRESNARPDIKFNVVVLGDVTEEFSRLIFPSIAGMLQKEKGRILPHHIHQGMEIVGSIFIPSNINSLKVEMRESMRRTLLEIDVQHKVTDMRGYDHIMIYQDVQTRTDCHYPALSVQQLQDYLFQCLIHLYYATDITHPLLSGTPAAENFYFSMGATSVAYDVTNEDLKASHQFGVNFMRSLKLKGTDEEANLNLTIFKDSQYEPEAFFDYEAIDHLDREDVKTDEVWPHPVKNYFHKYLKRKYYSRYLRDFTRNMMLQITSTIDDSTRGALEILASASKRKYNVAKQHIFDRLRDIFTELEANDGGLPTIINLFKEMQHDFSEKKKDIAAAIKDKFWNKIETGQVPRHMQDAFMEYHDTYEQDIREKNGGTRQREMKKEIVTELNEMLSHESTILSRFCRSILLGIMLALVVVPILNIISPFIINLGKVRRYSEWWSVAIFFLPVLFQVISWFRFERNKRRVINNLKALFLHDAFARVANRIESEIKGFYDKMIALGDLYIKRTESIRDEIDKGYENLILIRPQIPFTTFNQPLLGGHFGRFGLLPVPGAVETEIRINFIPYKMGEITDREYYIFLNQHRNIVMELYKDVDLCENLVRKIDESGQEELVTKEQQQAEQELLWKEHLSRFHTELSKTIRDSVAPRINDSVGEFLVSNIDGHIVQKDVLEPMVEYAANNGEATSSADLEMADLKVNYPRAIPFIFDYISTPFKYDQVSKHNPLYRKYIFLTRWRSYEDFSLNRFFPMEDFDINIRSKRVYKEEEKVYFPYPSTLLLWSLAPDDSSVEWFRLLDSDFFAAAYTDKEIYKEVLNPDD